MTRVFAIVLTLFTQLNPAKSGDCQLMIDYILFLPCTMRIMRE